MLWTVSRLAGGRGAKDWEAGITDFELIRLLFAQSSTSYSSAQYVFGRRERDGPRDTGRDGKHVEIMFVQGLDQLANRVFREEKEVVPETPLQKLTL
jgi:hypothetical protein